MIVEHENRDCDAFMLAYDMVMCTTGNTMFSHLADLMAAYFAFDINYPRQYQLPGLLQTELLQDHTSKFFQSVNYVKFVNVLSQGSQ